jgi:hypothetical protein
VPIDQPNRPGIADDEVILDPCRHQARAPLQLLIVQRLGQFVPQRSLAAAGSCALVRRRGKPEDVQAMYDGIFPLAWKEGEEITPDQTGALAVI